MNIFGRNRRKDPSYEPAIGYPTPLLPLDRARRLRRHIIDHAVDALDLVDDPRCHMRDEFHFEGIEIGGHAARGMSIAQTSDVIVTAVIAPQADGARLQNNAEPLTD